MTLYDRVLQQMVDCGLATAPTTTSYTNDVYPILQRARDMRWVEGIFGAHTWADPVTSQPLRRRDLQPAAAAAPATCRRSTAPTRRLTPTQYAHMQRWQAGNYTNDWTGVPAPETAITPDGLDRAALEACVGGAFFPGIEAGGLSAGDRPILEAPYAAAFRLAILASAPGTISQAMALPWQADFKACGDNWWPVPRPNDVIAQDTGSPARWDRDVASMDDMVDHWHTLGFVVRAGRRARRGRALRRGVDQPADPAPATSPTCRRGRWAWCARRRWRSPSRSSRRDRRSPWSTRPAAHRRTRSWSRSTPSVTVGPTAANAVATARLWVIYRTGTAPSSIPPQVAHRPRGGRHARPGRSPSTRNTVARKTAATALVLDRSGSMSEDRGDGQSKHDSLQQAANAFVDLMLEGDGVGIVRFNEDAQQLQPVLALGAGGLSDLNRGATHDVDQRHRPRPGRARPRSATASSRAAPS